MRLRDREIGKSEHAETTRCGFNKTNVNSIDEDNKKSFDESLS